MNPKVARFVPLVTAAFMFLREITAIALGYRFEIIYYIEDTFTGWSPFSTLMRLISLALKLGSFLCLIAIAKMLTDGKVRIAKFMAIGVFAAFILRGILTYVSGMGAYYSTISNVFAFLAFLSTIASTVIVLLVKDSNSPARTPRINFTMPAPVPFNPPVQSYSAQGAQSVPDQLSALEKLHISGVLSDAEFKAAKKKILE